MRGERKMMKLTAQDGKLVYEGMIRMDERSKQPIYDGAGYLFNNETKCFFKGTWSNHQKVCGIETFPNGDIFEGPYQQGKFHGIGLLYNNVNGKYRYEGSFDNGTKHGQGTEDYVTGGSYRGYFNEGVKQGEGKLTFLDGSYYMGDFFKGHPHGFGLHVAQNQQRIAAVFPINNLKEEALDTESPLVRSPGRERKSQKEEEEVVAQSIQVEYYYEGDFVDGFKHGIGRLCEPCGSYFYGYWEYNKPVGKVVYYNAEEHHWKTLQLKEMVEHTSIDFYHLLELSDWKSTPIKGAGYPDFRVDGYKCLIDEKGLKREALEDPDFDCHDQLLQVRDDSGSLVAAPVELKRLQELQVEGSGFALFKEVLAHHITKMQEIQGGCLQLSEQYSCQQLTCVVDAMTYHSHLFQRIFTRKYDSDIGFYILKLYHQEQWREFVVDDVVPVFRYTDRPIFSNSPQQDLGWTILFKCFAKMNQSFQYFQQCKSQEAENLLNMLTGIPCKSLSLVSIFTTDSEQQQDDIKINKTWKCLTEKHQKTQIRICYLRKQVAQMQLIPANYAYHFVDYIQSQQQDGEDKFILLKSLVVGYALKSEFAPDKSLQKMRDRNPQSLDDARYFTMGFMEFVEHFDNVVVLAGTRYKIHNQQELNPTTSDVSGKELMLFTRFCINLPSSMLFCVTQDVASLLPIRIVLAREKDLYNQKKQVKQEQDNIFIKPKKPLNDKPFKYVFGRGQRKSRQLYKEVTLDPGIYILLIQIETTEKLQVDKLKFYLSLHAQFLVQLQKIPQINQFQTIVYENAIIDAERSIQNEGRELKFFSKVDLSERENGSSDLIIIQYFLKNEGTYLQYLRNRSNNKIWRQKLYFRLENMLILNQSDVSKIDLQLNTSDKKTALVMIQQVGALPYNLEGGEGICIIDILDEAIVEQPKQEGDSPSNKLKDFSDVFQL